jgi:antitoxin PrlF
VVVTLCDTAGCAGRRGEAQGLPTRLADDSALAHVAAARGEAKHDGQHDEAGPDSGDCEGNEHQRRPFYSKLTFFVRNRYSSPRLQVLPALPGLLGLPGAEQARAMSRVRLPGITNWYTEGMRVTSKGQVTIPLKVRERLGIKPGSEVDFEVDERGARIVRAPTNRGREIARAMRGRGTVPLSTDEIMALTRGDG